LKNDVYDLSDFISAHATRFINQHDRHIIPNGVSQAISFADEFMFLGIEMQLAFAQRANQNIEQSFIHDFFAVI
jgi:hypothetical protein